MTPVNPFILKNKEKMINFLDELSVSASQHLCCFFVCLRRRYIQRYDLMVLNVQ